MTTLVEKKLSADGSYKFLFKLPDEDQGYEALYFKFSENDGPSETPIGCLSSQIGCALGCAFCATGRLGFKRNLTAGDLLETAALICANLEPGEAPPQILTFMGMGEPLLNLEALMAFQPLARRKLGVERLSLSTVVIPERLKRLAESAADYDLFVSLHSAAEEQRRRLIPASKHYGFADFFAACRYYHQKKLAPRGQKIKISYLLLEGLNDGPDELAGLVSLLRRHLPDDTYRVQLLLYNHTAGESFKKIALQKAREIQARLQNAGLDAYLSLSRGTDVGGGCGQFAGRGPGAVHPGGEDHHGFPQQS